MPRSLQVHHQGAGLSRGFAATFELFCFFQIAAALRVRVKGQPIFTKKTNNNNKKDSAARNMGVTLSGALATLGGTHPFWWLLRSSGGVVAQLFRKCVGACQWDCSSAPSTPCCLASAWRNSSRFIMGLSRTRCWCSQGSATERPFSPFIPGKCCLLRVAR